MNIFVLLLSLMAAELAGAVYVALPPPGKPCPAAAKLHCQRCSTEKDCFVRSKLGCSMSIDINSLTCVDGKCVYPREDSHASCSVDDGDQSCTNGGATC